MCEHQAEILALCDFFGLEKPIAFHATLDLAFELTTLNIDKCSLMYFYAEVLMRSHPFTADSRHRESLPTEVPTLPLPAVLTPGHRADYKLERTLSAG
jgi:hypothetical protein